MVPPRPFRQAESQVCPAASWRPRHTVPKLTSASRPSMVTPRGRHRLPHLGNPERPAREWQQPVLDVPKRPHAGFVPADVLHPATVGRCHKPPTLLGLHRSGFLWPAARPALRSVRAPGPVCVLRPLGDGYCGAGLTLATTSRWDEGAPGGIVDACRYWRGAWPRPRGRRICNRQSGISVLSQKLGACPSVS